MTERLSVSTYQPGQIKELWSRHHPRFLQRDAKIHLIRKLYAGELKIPLPDQFQVEGKEYLEFGLPTKWMMALHLTTVLQETEAKLRRDGGTNPAAEQRATTVELWSNAGIAQTLDQDTVVDLLLNEGECGLVVSMSGSSWDRKLDYLDLVDDPRDGYTAHGGGYARLDAKGSPLPKRRFQRDGKGRPPQAGDESFQLDDKQSAKAFTDEERDFATRHFPFTVRVLPADDCLPLYGPNLALEGLLVRSSFTREELIRKKYAWSADGDLMIGGGNPDYGAGMASGERLTLYEAWLLDQDGRPYCVYEVDGNETYTVGDDGSVAPAVTDLYAEYGMTRLPCAYEYGMHFARSNPQNPGAPLGIPFMWPLIGVLLMKEMAACGISLKAWWSGFPGYFFKPDENLLAAHPELMIDNNAPREFTIKPMAVTAVPGDVQIAQSPGLGAEVGALMNLLNEALTEYGPNPVSAGAAGATGVSDRSLIDEQIRRAYAPILKSRRKMVQLAGEVMVEFGARWCDRASKTIPIYADVPVPALSGSTRRKVTKRGMVELDADVVGENYSLSAYYPREFGDNLARTQQIVEAWKDGASTFFEMRELGFEDEDPEGTRVNQLLDKIYASDQYVADIVARALQATGDAAMAEQKRLEAQGSVGPDGLPANYMAGVPQQQPQQGQVPPGAPPMGPGGAPTVQMGLPNPGLSQMGGLVGAQMQAAQATAGPMAGQ